MKFDYPSSFKAKCHPRAKDVEAQLTSYFVENWPWGSEAEKERDFVNNLGAAGTLTVPEASYERTIVVSRYLSWAFLFDDKVERIPENKENRAQEQIQLFSNLILGTVFPNRSSKLQAATYDILQGFVAFGDDRSKELGRVVLQETAQWLQYVAILGLEKGSRRHLTFDDMMEYRGKTSGMWIMWPIMRWALEIYVPKNLLAKPEVRKLEELANQYAILVNDVCSYEKETHAAKANDVEMENVISTIMVEKGLPEGAAIRELYQHLQGIEEEFEATERELHRLFEGQDLAMLTQYVQAMKTLLGGTVEFSATSARYQVN